MNIYAIAEEKSAFGNLLKRQHTNVSQQHFLHTRVFHSQEHENG
jgi:hypothetical protein